MKRFLTLLLATAVLGGTAMGQQYKVTDKVKLGGEGGWDYLTADAEYHRVYITRGTHVMVIDSQTLKPAGDITGLSGIHGVALANELNKGFVSNGGDNTVTVFDVKTLQATDKVAVGQRPDFILYDPSAKRVYTFNAKSQDSTVIDATNGKVVGTIPLGGKPETAAVDGKGTLYVNIEDKNEIAKVDTNKLTVTARWPLKGCNEPSALAYDVAHQRLFSGCEKLVAVTDATNGKQVATVAIPEGVDAGAFDPESQQVFMSTGGGDGAVTVIHEDSPDKYTVAQTIATQKGARTMALCQKNKIVYTVTADRDPTPPPPGERPKMVPGSFTVIVLKAQ